MVQARQIRKDAKRYGIDLLLIKQKHLGSDCLPGHISSMADHLARQGVTIHCSESVEEIVVDHQSRVGGVITDKGRYQAPHVILAPGRVGAEWMASLAQRHRLGLTQRGIERINIVNPVDLDNAPGYFLADALQIVGQIAEFQQQSIGIKLALRKMLAGHIETSR